MKDHEIEIICKMCRNGIRFPEIKKLIQLANSHTRLCELECNQELTPGQISRKRNIREEIRELLPPKTKANFSGDPRGYTVKLILPDKSYNTWGGESEGLGIG